MRPPSDMGRFNRLIIALQSAENEAHAVGLHETAHAINAAKNKAGWEQADLMEALRIPEGKE